MGKCGRNRGAWNWGKRTYISPRTRGAKFAPEPNPVFIPLTKWCEENYYSKDQARTLIKKGLLLALKCKNQIFVKESEELKEINRSE